MRVIGMDHIVLEVTDVERSLAWYVDVLGLEPLRVDEFRAGEVPFPSVRIDEYTIIDIFGGRPDGASLDGNNLNHFCLVVDDADLDELAASGRFDVVSGPDLRWGARGDGRSLYVIDPDANTIELKSYGER